jgi:hypothetical protein
MSGFVLATTDVGCRAEGIALFVCLGIVALFSRQIAGALVGPRAVRDVITDRRPPDEGVTGSRQFYARLVHWGLRMWGAAGALVGAAVLVGIAHCN